MNSHLEHTSETYRKGPGTTTHPGTLREAIKELRREWREGGCLLLPKVLDLEALRLARAAYDEALALPDPVAAKYTGPDGLVYNEGSGCSVRSW